MKKSSIFCLALISCIILASCGGSEVSFSEISSVSETSVSPSVSEEPQEPSLDIDEPEEIEYPQRPERLVNDKEPVITEINRCVLTPADMVYGTGETYEYYRLAMDAMVAHESEVRLTDDIDANLTIMSYFGENPYAIILSDYDLTKDNKGLHFEYAYSEEDCTTMLGYIDSEYLRILNEIITDEMTDLEKVLSVHKYFCERISYDYDYTRELMAADEPYLFPDFDVYTALVTDRGVCHTYTYLCQFALQQLGIECERAYGEMENSDESHMWLVVWLDGKGYHVDLTWDDVEGVGTSLQYFGMTSEENDNRGIWCGGNYLIDIALDANCVDSRFSDWRDIVDYELMENHKMWVQRADGSAEIIDLSEYQ